MTCARVVKEGHGRSAPAQRPGAGVQTRSKGHSAGTGHFRTGQSHPTTPILSSPRFQIPISWKELDFRPLCLFLDPTKKQRARGNKISLERIFFFFFCIQTTFNVTATQRNSK